MSTYNSIIKKRNLANTDWDTILPVTTAENVMVDETNSVKDMISPLSSYMAFCANTNRLSLDAAFGRFHREEVKGIGKQLAMFAYFSGESEDAHPFENLKNCSTILDVRENTLAFNELKASAKILELVKKSWYAYYVLTVEVDCMARRKKLVVPDDFTFTSIGEGSEDFERGFYAKLTGNNATRAINQKVAINSGEVATHVIVLGDCLANPYAEIKFGYEGNMVSAVQEDSIHTLACPTNTDVKLGLRLFDSYTRYIFWDVEYMYLGVPLP